MDSAVASRRAGRDGREIVDEHEADEKERDGEGFAARFHWKEGKGGESEKRKTAQRSRTTTLRNSVKPVSERKKMTSFGSMMPFVNASKLRDETEIRERVGDSDRQEALERGGETAEAKEENHGARRQAEHKADDRLFVNADVSEHTPR